MCILPSKYKKSRAVFLYFDNFCYLILENNIVCYLSFVIIYGNLLKYIAAMKIAHSATLINIAKIPRVGDQLTFVLWSHCVAFIFAFDFSHNDQYFNNLCTPYSRKNIRQHYSRGK